MTPEERDNPDIIGASRKKRIAAGSGMKVEDVNKLLKQYDATKKMMKQLTSGNIGGFGGRMLAKRWQRQKTRTRKNAVKHGKTHSYHSACISAKSDIKR